MCRRELYNTIYSCAGREARRKAYEAKVQQLLAVKPVTYPMYLIWIGHKTSLPIMYEAGLQTMQRIYTNLTILSNTLVPKKGYPPILGYDLEKLCELLVADGILTMEQWRQLLRRLAQSTSAGHASFEADFLRVAVLYLHGGAYSDLDVVWLRPYPTDYRLEPHTVCSLADPLTRKHLVRINGRLSGCQNGFLVSPPGSRWFNEALARCGKLCWSSAEHGHSGTKGVNASSAEGVNATRMVYLNLYKALGVRGSQARAYFALPMWTELNEEVAHMLGSTEQAPLQMHVYGNLQHLDRQDIVPTKHSLYYELLRILGIRIPEVDPPPIFLEKTPLEVRSPELMHLAVTRDRLRGELSSTAVGSRLATQPSDFQKPLGFQKPFLSTPSISEFTAEGNARKCPALGQFGVGHRARAGERNFESCKKQCPHN